MNRLDRTAHLLAVSQLEIGGQLIRQVLVVRSPETEVLTSGHHRTHASILVACAERRSQIHLVVDDPGAAKMVLAAEGLIYTEGELVQVALRNLPGELARVTSRLAGVNVNINYAYGGSDLLFFWRC